MVLRQTTGSRSAVSHELLLDLAKPGIKRRTMGARTSGTTIQNQMIKPYGSARSMPIITRQDKGNWIGTKTARRLARMSAQWQGENGTALSLTKTRTARSIKADLSME